MTDALLPLAVCVAIGLIWHAAMRARERAIARALRLCAEHGAQMLDQSVVLHALRPLLHGGRPLLLRSYRFDLSYAGNDRHRGSLTFVGDRLLNYSLPARIEPDTPGVMRSGALRASHEGEAGMPSGERSGEEPSATPRGSNDMLTGSGKVVPITRGRRTLH